MDGVEGIDGLHFHHDPVLDDQIHTISEFDLLSVVGHRQSDLCGDCESALSEFVYEAGLIGAFQKARTEQGMNFHRGVHNGAGDLIYVERMRTYERSHL
jgi:hypothetical protein